MPGPKDSTVALLLGASRYPSCPHLDNLAFSTSVKTAKGYLLDSHGLSLKRTNVLDLFDAHASSSVLQRRIREFLAAKAGQDISDVVVIYIGHGLFANDTFVLALATTDEEALLSSSLPVEELADALRRNVPNARRYVILDCCFAASAHAYFQASGPLAVAARKTQLALQDALPVRSREVTPLDDALPTRGTALLCASSRKDAAKTPEGAKTTMFTDSLFAGLRNAPPHSVLSLREIGERCFVEMKERYGDEAVRPEVTSPYQPEGEVDRFPLFPTWDSEAALDGSASDSVEELRADDILCLTIDSERTNTHEGVTDLSVHVRRALERYGSRIQVAFQRHLDNEEGSNQPLGKLVQRVLSIEGVCKSAAALRNCVQLLVRANMVVIDVTDYQPGVMFMLGVRSVARRGVTICSTARDIEAQSPIPFNLQGLNLVSHSRGQELRSPQPVELLGVKLLQGVNELLDLPHYLDLPVYDAVRRLGNRGDSYRPIPFDERILVLCPFAKEYSDENWSRFLSQELPGKIGLRTGGKQPNVIRLLDVSTPRAVAQTLYEAVRLTDMCVIDWSDYRANVMFEMGVRTAVNPLGAVHIIDDSYRSTPDRPADELRHVRDLVDLFEPITYDCVAGESEPYEQMIDRFLEQVAGAKTSGDAGPDRMVYSTVGMSDTVASVGAPLSAVDFLIRDAEILLPSDEESVGVPATLFQDVNEQTLQMASRAAAERRLAAWLYLDAMYEADELAQNALLREEYRKLGAQARRWVRSEGRMQLQVHLGQRLKRLRDLSRSLGTTGHVALSRVVSFVATRIVESKDFRDEGDFDEAIAALDEAIDFLDSSGWADRLRRSLEVAPEEKRLAAVWADCYGMLGRLHRRAGNNAAATKSWADGARIEADQRYDVLASYCMVNAIAFPIETGQTRVEEQADRLREAVIALERQTGESTSTNRRTDRWAWADLGECLLLLGDLTRAKEAYRRSAELGSEDSLNSSLRVLEDIGRRLVDRDDPVAPLFCEGIAYVAELVTQRAA